MAASCWIHQWCSAPVIYFHVTYGNVQVWQRGKKAIQRLLTEGGWFSFETEWLIFTFLAPGRVKSERSNLHHHDNPCSEEFEQMKGSDNRAEVSPCSCRGWDFCFPSFFSLGLVRCGILHFARVKGWRWLVYKAAKCFLWGQALIQHCLVLAISTMWKRAS